MIFIIKGTHGSGKTTIVRNIMAATGGFKKWKPLMLPEMFPRRRTPCAFYHKGLNCFIVGNYPQETYSGGADNISSGVTGTRELIKHLLKMKKGCNIVAESMMFAPETKHTIELSKHSKVTVVAMAVSLEKCIRSIVKRRTGSGKDPTDFKTDHIGTRWRGVHNACAKLRADKSLRSRVFVYKKNRKNAYNLILKGITDGH